MQVSPVHDKGITIRIDDEEVQKEEVQKEEECTCYILSQMEEV